jgi:glycosyltransferase involved in cell wall biosynthesis
VTLFGIRQDVPEILRGCDIGILSSTSEGLPVALIEYGIAGLAAVATSVGQCPEVLDGGKCGVLVPAADSRALAEAILGLLRDVDRSRTLGVSLKNRVEAVYGVAAGISSIEAFYNDVLAMRS